jgi:tetratricopeptide (TPR) repeat protein
MFARVAGSGFLLWLVPAMVFLVRGLWTPHCDLVTGVVWYLVIPGVTVLYASAVGLFFALGSPRRSVALVATYTFVIVALAIAVRHLVVDPPLYATNSVVGYIPGPVYDEVVSLSAVVGWGRLGTVVWAVFFVSLAGAACVARRYELDLAQVTRFDGTASGLLARAGVAASLIALVLLHVYRQETGTSPTAASIQAALGGRAESEHFILYYDRAAIPHDRAAAMLDDHEFRLHEILTTLDLDDTPSDEKIVSYVYGSPDRKKALMGARRTSFADPFARAMHLNDEPLPHPVLKHELTHVVSKDYAGWLGFNPRIGIHEGLAVAVDWEQERLTPDQWAAVMQREELLPPLSQLASLAFWGAPATRAYLSTGSFVRHLLDRSSPSAVLAFFGDNDYVTHFGAERDSLEKAWREHLRAVDVDSTDYAFALSRIRRPAIFDRVCPRRIAASTREGWTRYQARDFLGAADSFDGVLALAPSDDGAALGRLRTLVAAGDVDVAEAWAHELLNRSTTSARTMDEARDALAAAAWKRGDNDSARVWYGEIIQANTTPSLVRGAHLKLDVLHHDGYRRLFTGGLGPSERTAELSRLASNGPAMSIASYLLGRQLYQEGSLEGAIDYLDRSLISWLPSRELRSETARILGVAHYRRGQFELAEESFRAFARAAVNPADQIRAASWIERCGWLLERHAAVDGSDTAAAS